MNYITHSLGGAAAGGAALSAAALAFGAPIGLPASAVMMAGSVLGALLPDIDHQRSWISRKVPVISNILAGFFKHRGVAHTPCFIAALSILAGLAGMKLMGSPVPYWPCFLAGLISGMLSHLILDTLNPKGIMWLWPISAKRYHLWGIKVNGIGESFVCLGLIAILCILAKEGAII